MKWFGFHIDPQMNLHCPALWQRLYTEFAMLLQNTRVLPCLTLGKSADSAIPEGLSQRGTLLASAVAHSLHCVFYVKLQAIVNGMFCKHEVFALFLSCMLQ